MTTKKHPGKVEHSFKVGTLKKELDTIEIDYTAAYEDLGNDTPDDGAKMSLWKAMPKELQELVKPLLKMNVYPEEKRLVELGEFDDEALVFQSVKVGREIRNGGVPGFKLTLLVNGYAPTTMRLEINETFWWGEESR
jgi:hypothetical protein